MYICTGWVLVLVEYWDENDIICKWNGFNTNYEFKITPNFLLQRNDEIRRSERKCAARDSGWELVVSLESPPEEFFVVFSIRGFNQWDCNASPVRWSHCNDRHDPPPVLTGDLNFLKKRFRLLSTNNCSDQHPMLWWFLKPTSSESCSMHGVFAL